MLDIVGTVVSSVPNSATTASGCCVRSIHHMEKAKLVCDPHDMYVLHSMVGVSLLSFPVVAVCVRLW